jgi:predicted ATPase
MTIFIPTPLTTLIGREAEIAVVEELINRPEVRLVTLCGPGGVGKTRLALHLASSASDHFRDGAAFVNLAPLGDWRLVVVAIAQALSVREQGDRSLVDLLIAYLDGRHLLLVLDTFERLLPAAALLADILSVCSNLKLLVTSRSVLRVSGEYVFTVSPLALPDPIRRSRTEEVGQCGAVQLFVARAKAAQVAFQLTDENSAAVAAICQQLNGLPLAIELAAARVAVLPPQALLTQLEYRHHLAVLTGGARDLPERLQTLRNAITWSFQLLSYEEQALFRRLAVFAGSFTLTAVETLDSMLIGATADTLTSVSALVDQSLLQPLADDEARFLMLDTLREYALEQLAVCVAANNNAGTH